MCHVQVHRPGHNPPGFTSGRIFTRPIEDTALQGLVQLAKLFK